MKYYYHITDLSNLKPIMKDGLKAGHEAIFLLDSTDINLIRNVAMNQCGLRDLALLQIAKKGIKTKIKRDNVAEFMAGRQFYTEQELIASEYIEFVSEYHFTDRDQAELTLAKYKTFGWDYTLTDVIEEMKYIEELSKKK